VDAEEAFDRIVPVTDNASTLCELPHHMQLGRRHRKCQSLGRTDMNFPGFTAEASIYQSKKPYLAPPLVSGIQMARPNGVTPQQRITFRFLPWLTDCLMGCNQNYGSCVDDVPHCTSRCEPDCIGSCEARCFVMPEQRQLDCLAACPDMCLDSCHSNCQIACATAYGDCVNFCYNFRIVHYSPNFSQLREL
jgi:hypothetical protein